MKKFLVLSVVVCFSLTSTLKAQAFKNGDMVGNLGVGFGWYGFGGYGVTSLPAFSLSLEKGILDIQNFGPLSVGGIVGIKHASYTYLSSDKWSWNDIIVAARGAVHYDLFKNNKVDTYGGIAVGVRIESFKSTAGFAGINGSSTLGLFALYVGGRYFFSDNFAAFGELGYGLGYLTLGLSYKF
jgi:hypothetical protein